MVAASLASEPARREAELEMREIRATLVQRLSAVLIVLSVFSWGFVISDLYSPLPFLILLSLTVEGSLAFAFRRLCPPLAWASLLIGPTISLAAAVRLVNSSSLPYLASVIIMANAAFNPLMGLAAAGINTLVLLTLMPAGQTTPIWAIGLIWLTVVVEWVSSRSLHTALEWSRGNQLHVASLLEEARSRRAELNRVLTALREATDRLARTNHELAVARQQADEARVFKDQFVANVSHELRTPLNLIVGFVEMMYVTPESYEGVEWTPELVSDIGELYRASRHLQSLVNDILDLARMDASRLPMLRELLDVRLVINEAIETIAPLIAQRGLSCRSLLPEDLPLLLIDRTRIRQVMLNLLTNAVRFTDAGTITVRVERTDDAIVVSVADTGVGIPPERLGHIFERFAQTDAGPRRKGGAGLGLALSREFICLHGGRMWAESQMGLGSTFYFSLPLPGARTQMTSLQMTAARQPAEVLRSPVLVVDPDPSVAGMLSRYLGDRRVLSVRDTSEAEALIEVEHPLAIIVNLPPDLAPGAWLGEVGELSTRYTVPILRCSLPSASWLQRATDLDACLAKPVSRQALQAVVRQYCPEAARILIVDDDPGFVSLINRMLKTMRLTDEVLFAYDGAEAIRLTRELKPNLVLLDLVMPEVDGFQVLKAIRSQPTLDKTAVVAVTATSYAEEALLRRGGYLTLTQPRGISPGRITELLAAVLEIVQPDYVRDGDSTCSKVWSN